VATARRCRTYVGVDVSDAAVTMAREVGLNAQTIADGSDLPLADASVDFVACLEVMEHVFTSEETAAEMYRVLRPGGTLIVQVPNVAHWRHRFDLGVWGRFVALGDHQTLTRPWRDPHIRFYTFDAMRRLLQYTGFDITEVSGIGGNQAAHVPLLGKHIRNEHAGPLSRRLFQMRPGLFANRILIAATR
jgi:SAM-dependent methyltransferase